MGASEILRRHLKTQCRHRFLRVFQRYAGLQPRHHLRVVPREVPSHPGWKGSRHPDVNVVRGHEVELARHDADHLVRVVVHGDRPAHYIGRPAIAPLPQSVADDDDPHAFLVFCFREHPPDQRIHAQYAPKIRGRLTRWDLFRLRIAGERGVSRLGGRDVGENRVEAPPLQPFGGRGKALREALAVQVVPDHDETVRAGVRQGTNQYRVEGAEHRRNSANAERQGCDCDGGER